MHRSHFGSRYHIVTCYSQSLFTLRASARIEKVVRGANPTTVIPGVEHSGSRTRELLKQHQESNQEVGPTGNRTRVPGPGPGPGPGIEPGNRTQDLASAGGTTWSKLPK